MLLYGDFRIENDIETKRNILKKLDLTIEKNKTKLKGHYNGLYERM